MKFRRDPAPVPEPHEQTDAEEWKGWRAFVGSKRVCPICGAVIGDPDLHKAWHETPHV